MKRSIQFYCFVTLFFLILFACKKDNKINFTPPPNNPDTPPDYTYVATWDVAKESVVRSIPVQYIESARNNLHIAYQHTSHGTHASYGLFGLQDYKDGDDVLFGITNNNPTNNKLDFHDYALSNYAPEGISGADLSQNEIGFIQTTRNFLDANENADINVVMWSWCDIGGHNVSDNYLPGIDSLINEYGVGGTKIGTGAGQRATPVTFILMTGHANGGSNECDGCPKNQADLIINYCETNHQYCLDYYGIDSHDMNDNYWLDVDDNANSDLYGYNFNIYFQDTHSLGVDYFENKSNPGGDVTFGDHNTQHITANRKAYAMWWILARIAGWDGN